MSEALYRSRKRGDPMEGILQEIEEVNEQIKEVDERIKKMETKLEVIEAEITEAISNDNQEVLKYLREEKKDLREEKILLMEKEKLLMEKEKLLMENEREEKRPRLDDKWKSIGKIKLNSDTPWLEGGCLKLQLAEDAGLSPATLYMRHEVKNLWDSLNKKRKKCALISGYPGVGKSSVAWAWVCWMATKNDKNVLWIHYEIGKPSIVLYLKRDECTKLESELCDSVPNFIQKGCYDLVVLDGIVQSSLSTKLFNSSQSLVLVSSVGFHFIDEHFPYIEKLCLESWTLSDYQNACNNEAIYDALPDGSTFEKKAEIIEERFYLAGHCARYFFCYSLSDIQFILDEHIDRLPNSIVHFTSMAFRPKAQDTVHHLLATVNGKTTLCSSYVCKKLMFEYDFSFLKELLKWCKGKNPSLEGQVFELAFLAYLKGVHEKKIPNVTSIKLCNSVDKDESWDIKGGYCHFEPTKIESIPPKEWLIPEKFNQLTYDLVQLEKDKKMLRLVQLTKAKSHTINCDYVTRLVVALELVGFETKVLDFVVLFPKEGTKPMITYRDKIVCQDVLKTKKISLFGDEANFSVRFLQFSTQLLFDFD